MTAAFNLSQLANNLNTSGQLDATDGLNGIVPVANGGTGRSTLTANNVVLGNGTSAVGLVAPGTSGNVLVSDGTTWASGGISKLSTASGNAPSFSARAWGYFIGSSTPSVTGGNISSVGYGGVPGVYNVNFATNMQDTNYAVTVTSTYSSGGNNPIHNAITQNALQTNQFQLVCIQYGTPSPSFFNGLYMMFAVFR
jgi:hypothetical protein